MNRNAIQLRTTRAQASIAPSSKGPQGFQGGVGATGATGPPIAIPGPYANDAAAAAGGVALHAPYYQASGAVVVRLV